MTSVREILEALWKSGALSVPRREYVVPLRELSDALKSYGHHLSATLRTPD
jgi:hypothetical protein